MPKYLTVMIKEQIKRNIEFELKNTNISKCLESEIQELSDDIIKYVNYNYPFHDMNIIKKYRLERTYNSICVGYYKNELGYGRSNKPHMFLIFNPAIELPTSEPLINIIIHNYKDRVTLLIEKSDNIKSKFNKLINSRMSIIRRYIKVDNLIAKHPEFEKYLPEYIEEV